MASTHSAIPPPGPNTVVGGPFAFPSGPFAGRILRAALNELQKADLGRKYARKDKRPLDPPPVVRLRCFQTIMHAGTRRGEKEKEKDSGSEREKELTNFDEHSIFGFICHVDLLPFRPGGRLKLQGPPAAPGASASNLQRPPPQNQMVVVPARFVNAGAASGGTAALPQAQYAVAPAGTNDEPCTSLLHGETFVPCRVVEFEGRQTAMFVFSDLAVRQEGQFILRYRVFNISGEQQCVPILAECYGGPFEIFSTKSFPGLKASTDLTKSLSLSGVRVNSRRHERRVGKKAHYSPDSPTEDGASGSGATLAALVPAPGPSRGRYSAQTASVQPAQGAPPGFFGGLSAPNTPFSGLFGAGSDRKAGQAALDAWQERERRSDEDSRSRSRESAGSGRV